MSEENSINLEKGRLSRIPLFLLFFAVLLIGVLVGGIAGYQLSSSTRDVHTEPDPEIVLKLPSQIRVASNSDFFHPDPMAMILIPAGEFTMGSETGDPDEKPAHTIYVDNFYIDQYEVTNLQYKACVDEGVCREPYLIGETQMSSKYYGDPQYGDYPVNTVNWHMAKMYCEWRGARLPTEPEWEKAARGPDVGEYPWGDEIDCSYANYDGCIGHPVPVGSYEPGKNGFGLYDMAGNVWEWVKDPIQNYPYQPDFKGQISEYESRVVRGGGWMDNESSLRTSNRSYLHPWLFYDYHTVGFRCAMTAEP